MADNLEDAIASFRAYALVQFNDAYNVVKNRLADEAPDKDKKRYAAMQGQMASALQQLAHADVLASDMRGRAGYEAVVQLMTQTRAAAGDAYGKLKDLTAADLPDPATGVFPAMSADRQTRIALLIRILEQLAAIAPIAIWQGAASSSSA
jgi:hypothetical protein